MKIKAARPKLFIAFWQGCLRFEQNIHCHKKGQQRLFPTAIREICHKVAIQRRNIAY